MFFWIKQENGRIKMTDVPELSTSQEEADTKVFVCCAHARDDGFSGVCIFTVDSDTLKNILAWICMQKLVWRRISISTIFNFHGPPISTAITALHSFTGNDYISSFHGQGKKKAIKLLKNSPAYQEVFKKIGDSYEFDVSLFATIQTFVCELYGLPMCVEVNEACYKKFCSMSSKIPDPEKLPPTSVFILSL